MKHRFRSRCSGLIEILTCIAIMAMLCAFLAPPSATGQTVTLAGQVYTESTNAAGQVILLPFSGTVIPGALSTNAPIEAPPATISVTTPDLSSPLSLLQSYLIDNDTNCTVWNNNFLTLWQAAVFSSVKGTPGASAIGNDLGLEVPIHKYNLHIESVTRFEQLFGDVHSQAVGLGYDYNLYQIQLSAGVALETTFANNAWRAVPFLEFKKASMSLAGMSPLFRYEFPVQKDPGAGRILVGVQMPLAKKKKS